MTAPPRLLQSSKNPATRQLLEAGLRDRASERAVLGLTAALGLDVVTPSAATGSALHAAGHASAPTAAAAGGAALPAASGVLPSALSIAKWLLLGACAGGVTSAGIWVSQEPPAAVSTPSRDSAPRAAPRRPVPSRAPSAISASPAVLPATSSTAPSGRNALAPNTIPTATSAPSESARGPQAQQGAELGSRWPAPVEGAAFPAPNSQLDAALERETRLVAGARQALSERDRARAAALLDNYDATKVLGVLDREALLLRVELSLARGDRPGAQALAEQFERSYPTDAHIPRLRALLAGAAKKNDSPR